MLQFFKIRTLNYFKVDTKNYSISVNGDTAHMKVTHTLTAKVYGISGSWTMSGENTDKNLQLPNSFLFPENLNLTTEYTKGSSVLP